MDAIVGTMRNALFQHCNLLSIVKRRHMSLLGRTGLGEGVRVEENEINLHGRVRVQLQELPTSAFRISVAGHRGRYSSP